MFLAVVFHPFRKADVVFMSQLFAVMSDDDILYFTKLLDVCMGCDEGISESNINRGTLVRFVRT